VNQIKTGAILSYLNIMIGSIISILYTPIMLRLLGQSEFGLYNLVSSIVAYLGLFNFGFGNAYIKYYASFKVEKDDIGIAKLNGMFMLIFLVLGAIAIISGLALTYYSDIILGNKLNSIELEKAKWLMLLLVVNMGITFPGIVYNSYVTANERFIFQRLLQIITIITSPFLIIPALLMGYGSIGIAAITTFVNLLSSLTNIYYSHKILKIKFSYTDLKFGMIKDLFIFSSYIFLNLIVNQINWNVDRFIIGRIKGTSEVAIYSIAAQLNSYYMQFSTAFTSLFIPRVNQLVASENDNWKLTELFTKMGRILFYILSLIFLGLIFFGKAFISLWAGNNYQTAYPIAMILIIPVTIPLIQNIGIEIQRAKNMHKFRSWVYFFIALGNILISIPLVKLYGGIGAAIGTSISLIIGNVIIMNWYYQKRIGLDIFYFFKSIFSIIPSLIIPVILGIIMMSSINLTNWLYLIISITIFAFAFFISIWKFAMNKDEKELLLVPLSRLIKKIK